MVGVLPMRTGCGEAKHATGIHCLERQAAAHQCIEHTVDRHPVGVGQKRLQFGMTQGRSRGSERLEHAHAPGRLPYAGGTEQVDRSGWSN